ncbi:hypothetical protein FJ366_02895 [Candidatus Dependentiae bacterium]|nr:hypothetical protein [Candidatus Dependentiae bacterium]
MNCARLLFLCGLFSVGLLQGKHVFAVPTYKQRVAIERLSSFGELHFDRFSSEIQKKKEAKRANLVRILQKKSDDLTPFEQLDLLGYTLPVKALDPLVSDFLVAFFVSYFLQAVEYYIAAGVSEFNGKSEVRRRTVLVKEHIEIEESLGVNSSRGQDFSTSSLFNKFQKRFENTLREVFQGMKFFWGQSNEVETDNSDQEVMQKKAEHRRVRVSQPLPKQADSSDEEPEWKSKGLLPTIKQLFSRLKINNSDRQEPVNEKNRKIFQAFYTHDSYPGQLIVKEIFLKHLIKSWPILKRIRSSFCYHKARLGGRTAEAFLEHILKHISSELAQVLQADEKKNSFVRYVIESLWNKHAGNDEKIYQELEKIYDNFSQELLLGQEKRTDQYWKQLAFRFHANMVNDHKLTFVDAISRGFRHGTTGRLFYSAGLGAIAVMCMELFRMYGSTYFYNYAQREDGFGFVKVDKRRMFFWGAFVLMSAWSCKNKLATYRTLEAERDYRVFLTRQGLLAEEKHAEKFYWGWFLPEWKMKKKNLLDVEKEFNAYVEQFSGISKSLEE